MVAAIAAAAVARRERMEASLASGKRWCPRGRGGGHFAALADFGSSRSAPSGLCGYCREHAAEYGRNRNAAKRAAAAEAASTATRAAAAAECARTAALAAVRDARRAGEFADATAVVLAAQQRRQVLADQAATDAETRTLVVAVRWRLRVGDGDAARVAALVVPRTVRNGAGTFTLDCVETFARLSDGEAAALAQLAGVALPEPPHRRSRAA